LAVFHISLAAVVVVELSLLRLAVLL